MKRSRPDPAVQRWIDSTGESCQYLSVVSLAEIIRGITRHPDSAQQRSLQYWVDDTLRVWFKDRLISISQEIAETAGRITGHRDKAGRPLSFADAFIAATAMEHRLVLVTRNTRDFQGLDLDLLDPWTTEV